MKCNQYVVKSLVELERILGQMMENLTQEVVQLIRVCSSILSSIPTTHII